MELSEQQQGKQADKEVKKVQERNESHTFEVPKEVTKVEPVEEVKKPSEDRISMLSDGIFAIAVTLLVLNIQIPLASTSRNEDAFKAILSGSFLSETISYFITFAVLAFYWINHRDLMNGLKRINRNFILLNLLFLAFVAFFPVASNLLHYDQFPEAVAIYTAVLAGCGYSSLLLLFYAHQGNLLCTDGRSFNIKISDFFAAAITPTFFLLSLLLLLIPQFYAGNLFYSWFVLPIIGIIIRRLKIFNHIRKAEEKVQVASNEPSEPHG